MNSTHIRFTVAALIVSSIIMHVATGLSAVIFPLTLERSALDTTFIGIILSMEFLAVLPVSRWLTRWVAEIGMVKVLLMACLLRVIAVLIFYYYHLFPLWCFLVFLYGMGGFMYLIAVQTWLNSLPLTKNRGLVTGLFGTSISVGIAIGPLIVQFIPILGPLPFYICAVMSLITFLPLLMAGKMVTRVREETQLRLMAMIKRAPAIMGAGMFAGLMIFGLLSFLVIYGLQNKLEAKEAAFLLTMFMAGSICLETPIASISDRFDRRYVIIISVFISLVCATYLPIAIYTPYVSWILLFIWGGVSGGIYSMCLAIIGDRFQEEELVTANSAYAVMDALGGGIGTLLIGLAMTVFGSDGLPYVIVLAGIMYFTYALSRYRVQ